MEKKEYSVVEFIQYLKDKPYIKLYKAARLAEISMQLLPKTCLRVLS